MAHDSSAAQLLSDFSGGVSLGENKLCTLAARCANLEILVCARACGCSWDEDVCAYAAALGRVDMLKWARENDGPWDNRTCHVAARTRRLRVLMWTAAIWMWERAARQPMRGAWA